MQSCRIRGNAEVRPPNVSHRQRHEVERIPNGILHLFFVPLFAHNSHSNFGTIATGLIRSFPHVSLNGFQIMNKPPPQIKLNVLIACEESQTSCLAFRQLGHNAYSCDLQPCSGGHPEWHIQGDALDLLELHWDLVIAHPPCTYLSAAAARYMWAGHKVNRERLVKAMQARSFFMNFYNAACPHIAIENPRPLKIVGLPWSTQVIEPWEFGEPWSKETHLWLKDLPLLRPTKIVTEFKSYTHYTKGSVQRSKTFPGLAAAWADQWSRFILESDYS